MRIYFLHLSCIAAVFLLLFACEQDEVERPIITEIRNYAASPDDTVVQTVSAGQWVIVMGKNLSGVSQVYFNGVPATTNSTLFTDQSIVIQIPSIEFQSVPADKANVITVVNSSGQTSFEINITGAPLITRVRNYAAPPDDNIIESVIPDQQINLVGYNLNEATKIAFQGIEADLTDVIYTDSSAIVRVPSELSGGDASLVNTISFTTIYGTGTFSIQIIGPPIITDISYELPKEGDVVRIYGNNLFNIQSLTFAGATISEFEASEDGSSLEFVSPALSQAGPVVVTNPAGEFTTAYNVNDINFINAGGMGILGNVEWGNYFGWQWWGGSVDLYSSDPNSGWPSYNTDYGVGTGMYLTYSSNKLNPDQGDDGNSIRLGEYEWVPTDNRKDPGSSWSLKFEINVTKPWNGGTICIRSNNGSYLALYEPWKVSAPFTTTGWQTVTIPLSAFRMGDGKGESITKVSDLLDVASGKSYLTIYLHNYDTKATATSFTAAFDNFRVVKR